MPTAFVTGATGFLGSHLVEQLVHAGFRVTALHRASSNVARLRNLPVTLAQGSLTRADLTQLIPKDCDALFHVAANLSFWSGDRDEQTRVNVDGTRHVVDAALARGVKRFVHTSSVSAFAGQPVIPFDESCKSTALASPVGYERTKYLGEVAVREGIDRGLDAVIVNPGNLIGRYDVNGWARFFVLIQRGKLPGVPPAGGTFCEAESVARAHIAAAMRGECGASYLLGGADATYLEMVRQMGELLKKPVPKRTVPMFAFAAFGWGSQVGSYFTRRAPSVTPELVHMARRGPVHFSSARAVRDLDYQTVPLSVMLEKSWRWLRDEGLLGDKHR
jgi:dihydroflavonol-4-reductase